MYLYVNRTRQMKERADKYNGNMKRKLQLFSYDINLEILGKSSEINTNKWSVTKLTIKMIFFLYRSQY